MRKAMRLAVPAALAAALMLTGCNEEEVTDSSSGGSEGAGEQTGETEGNGGEDTGGGEEQSATGPTVEEVEGTWYTIDGSSRVIALGFVIGDVILQTTQNLSDTCNGVMDDGGIVLGDAENPCTVYAGADGTSDTSSAELELNGETLTVSWQDGQVEEYQKLPDELTGEQLGGLTQEELMDLLAG